jgi:hypothetical protein
MWQWTRKLKWLYEDQVAFVMRQRALTKPNPIPDAEYPAFYPSGIISSRVCQTDNSSKSTWSNTPEHPDALAAQTLE